MIDIKAKKCKGIGQAYGVSGCKKITKYRKYGLCQSCLADFILNTDKGKVLLEKAKIKATSSRVNLEKASIERKERMGLTSLLNSVKNVCHKYVRLRDKGKPCVSCKTIYKSDFQAGHFYKAELFSTIKFNELNINGQCVRCNIRKDGNESEYRVNLPDIIGIEKFNELDRLASYDKKTNHKWDRENLIQIRNYYNNKIKQL
jgi:hypothetical protein